jgi:hypothetical protein
MSATIHAHVRLVKAPDICITDLQMAVRCCRACATRQNDSRRAENVVHSRWESHESFWSFTMQDWWLVLLPFAIVLYFVVAASLASS